jgi:hypothetical protein
MVIPNEPLLTRTCLLLLPSHSTSYPHPLTAVCNVPGRVAGVHECTTILVFKKGD